MLTMYLPLYVPAPEVLSCESPATVRAGITSCIMSTPTLSSSRASAASSRDERYWRAHL